MAGHPLDSPATPSEDHAPPPHPAAADAPAAGHAHHEPAVTFASNEQPEAEGNKHSSAPAAVAAARRTDSQKDHAETESVAFSHAATTAVGQSVKSQMSSGESEQAGVRLAWCTPSCACVQYTVGLWHAC